MIIIFYYIINNIMNVSIFIINIILHVCLMAFFLTFFFFTIGVSTEKEIVNKQITYLVNDILGNTFLDISPIAKDEIKTIVKNEFSKLDFTKLDERVKKNNKEIFNKSMMFLTFIGTSVLIIFTILYFSLKWNINHLKYFGTTIIVTLIFVAISETSFLKLIFSNYLSADPNMIKEKIIETLYKNRKKTSQK